MKARIGDVDIHYEVSGSGPWITLSHSLAASSAMWAPQLRVLEPHFTVLRLDTRGHGGSSAPEGDYDLAQLADDALGLLVHLGVARTHWLGLSMGGMIAQVLALRHPQVLDRVILADTTARGAPGAATMWAQRAQAARDGGMAPLVAPTLERWFTAPFRQRNPEVLAQVGAMIAATPAQGYAGCCAAIAGLDTLDALPTLHHPALVIVGEQDPGTPPAMARQIANAWPGARLALIPEAAHLANLEQPEAFNREVLRFLGVASPN